MDLLWIWGQLIYRTGYRTARAVLTDNLVWGRRESPQKNKQNPSTLLSVVVHCFIPSPQEAETRDLWFLGQPGLHNEFQNQSGVHCVSKKNEQMGCGHMSILNLIYIWCICLFELKGLPLPSPECRDQKYAPPLLAVSSFLRKHERKSPTLQSPNPILRQRAVWLAACLYIPKNLGVQYMKSYFKNPPP